MHRDVKPTNFANGSQDKRQIYMFDFGLARQILISVNGKQKLRDARTKVSFRGTVRYCSLNVHQYKEQGRHDDLWSWLVGHVMCLMFALVTYRLIQLVRY